MGSGASKSSSLQDGEAVEESWSLQRVVLVTGCSSGIGLAIAVSFAHDSKKRFKVYASMRDLSKREALENAAGDVLGNVLVLMELDVCSDESVNNAVAEIIEKEGRIDILVNNAGLGLFAVAECADMGKVQSIFDTNVFGLIRMTNSVVPHMKRERSGHLIHISSVYGLIGIPFGEIFSATKFAVEGFAESFAPVLQKFNIRSTIIESGPVTTSFAVKSKTLREEIDISSTDDMTKSLLKSYLQSYYNNYKTFGQSPEEIADVVKRVVLLKNPHLRYQTNLNYRQKEIASKVLDKTGNKVIELLGICEACTSPST